MLLMEGRALTAKELAYGAGVEPATGTSHLQRLLADDLVVCAAEGRHKYFRLASAQVAQCVEALMVIALPAKPTAAKSLPPLHSARLCYDHLAGRLGTEVTLALLQRDLVRVEKRDVVISKKGKRWFTRFGIDVDELGQSRRKLAYACLDWSERKDHLAGALGAAVAQRMLTAGWVKKSSGTRALSVTKAGIEALASNFGIQWA